VIEFRAEPGVEAGMATLTICGREHAGLGRVWRIGGALPIFKVARIALGGQTQEYSSGSLLVTVVALSRGVPTEKREAILVIFDLLRGDIPTLNGVTLRAIRTHFAAMNVGVTIGTILANIRENGLDVAGNTLHVFVHATERVIGFIVIEFRYRPDGTPTGRGMTVLTGDVERTVRIAGSLFLRVTRRTEMGGVCRDSRHRSRRVESKESPERELE
jgi:hypothetical protein